MVGGDGTERVKNSYVNFMSYSVCIIYCKTLCKMRKVFEFAREISPCILFLDELQSIGQSRSYRGSFKFRNEYIERRSVLEELLIQLDGTQL